MEPEDSSDPERHYFHRLADLEAYYLASLPRGQSEEDDTSKFYKLLGKFASPAALNLSPSQSPPLNQSAGTSTYQDTSDNTPVSMTNFAPEDYYPEGKIYEILTKYILSPVIEESSWHGILKGSIEMLDAKLGSPRLAKLDQLWYSGFDDRELKKLERSLLTVKIVLDDIMREDKDIKLWRIQHRHLKDLLCEAGDILDDIALRAPQLKQLFQSNQVSNPYLTEKLVQMNNLIQELDSIAIEIQSVVLPEFNTRRKKPPGPKIPSNQLIATSSQAPTVDTRKNPTRGKKNDPSAVPVVNERPVYYAFVGPQGTTEARMKDEPVKNYAEIISQFYDFNSSLKEDVRMRKSTDTESTHKPQDPKEVVRVRKSTDTESIHRPHDPVIYDEGPSATSSSNVSLSTTITSIDGLPIHLRQCLLYTSLFPRNYVFDKDMLVQMWIAVGYIRSEGKKLMEDTSGDYFDELLSMSFFQVSTRDESRYILQDDVYKLVQERAADEYARLEDGNLNAISKRTLHASILYESAVDPMIFKTFHKLKGLHTLLLLHESRKYIKQIPYDLILSLRCVQVLDLSGTQIKELPSSVGDMKTLHYLDLSRTPIKSLPQSICSLSTLQVLKLRDCLNFVALPKNMKNIINLRHLELDIIRQLTFMPPRMGRLTKLQTLSAFIAGKERGSKIAELKDMIDLRGSLRIVKLENVLTVEDAEEATLYDKQYLHRLELQWSLQCVEAVDILEGLEPHKNLIELEIVCYGGRTFPTWFGDSSFSKLADIYIYNCKNCIGLPLLGRLPSLKSLHIGEMHALKKVDQQFCGGGRSMWFSKLETLDFDGMPSLEEWTGIQENGMPCLRKLTIVDCPNLVKLPELSNLKSLQHLEISLCFKLQSLAEKRLPISLQTLIITLSKTQRRVSKGRSRLAKDSRYTHYLD